MSDPSEFDSAPASNAGDFLWGFWYPAHRSAELRPRKLHTTLLLGLPIVLGRDSQDRPFALRDNCPHRAMPFSCGRFDGAALECIYHGWKFDPHTGQCLEIPALPSDSTTRVDRIFAGAFPCAERDGYVWVFLPAPGSRPALAAELPPVPELPVFSPRCKTFFHSVEFPSDIDQGILGLIDPAHGPYVHQSWFWRSSGNLREKQKSFEPIPNGFRMAPHSPSANSAAYKILGLYGEPPVTTIDFVLPGIRVESIRCGKFWFTNRTIMTPLSQSHCRLDFCAAWNIFSWVPLVTSVFGWFARRFIAQDQSNFEMQAAGLRSHPRMMLVGDADRQARWYFELKAAWQAHLRTGAPMRHPLDGPVTLRWRT
jgi:phenylpropionate dioxygenase-like ring-hydroxylating dioxygenase large terminal subunit